MIPVLRNYIDLVVSLFSNIYIDNKPVPIEFGRTMRYMVPQGALDTRTDIVLPVLAVDMAAPMYAPNRALNQVSRVVSVCDGVNTVELLPTPYDIPFVLYIKTKTVYELFTILESILPYFNPSITFKYDILHRNKLIFVDSNMSLTMNNPSERMDTFIEDGKRSIEWQIDFTLAAWLFRQNGISLLDSTPLINEVVINMTQSNFYVGGKCLSFSGKDLPLEPLNIS